MIAAARRWAETRPGEMEGASGSSVGKASGGFPAESFRWNRSVTTFTPSRRSVESAESSSGSCTASWNQCEAQTKPVRLGYVCLRRGVEVVVDERRVRVVVEDGHVLRHVRERHVGTTQVAIDRRVERTRPVRSVQTREDRQHLPMERVRPPDDLGSSRAERGVSLVRLGIRARARRALRDAPGHQPKDIGLVHLPFP